MYQSNWIKKKPKRKRKKRNDHSWQRLPETMVLIGFFPVLWSFQLFPWNRLPRKQLALSIVSLSSIYIYVKSISFLSRRFHVDNDWSLTKKKLVHLSALGGKLPAQLRATFVMSDNLTFSYVRHRKLWSFLLTTLIRLSDRWLIGYN